MDYVGCVYESLKYSSTAPKTYILCREVQFVNHKIVTLYGIEPTSLNAAGSGEAIVTTTAPSEL